MAIYLFDCAKCTNKYIGFQNGKLSEWCKPVVDGVKDTIYVSKDTGSGRTMEFSCDYYTTELKQQEIRAWEGGAVE